MTYEQLEKVNKELETMNIRGKGYVMVNKRVMAFRQLFPNGAIVTDLLSNENGVCVIKAIISDEEGKVLGTGTAYEKETASNVNNTSYIENCETSAVGRALAMVGIGIDSSMCSAEELANALMNQEASKNMQTYPKTEADAVKPASAKQVDFCKKLLDKAGVDLQKVYDGYGIKDLSELNAAQAQAIINKYNK